MIPSRVAGRKRRARLASARGKRRLFGFCFRRHRRRGSTDRHMVEERAEFVEPLSLYTARFLQTISIGPDAKTCSGLGFSRPQPEKHRY